MNQFVPLNKNCQKTYCQSYTCSLSDKWVNGCIKKNKSMGTYKTKINPTIDQQVILNKLFKIFFSLLGFAEREYNYYLKK